MTRRAVPVPLEGPYDREIDLDALRAEVLRSALREKAREEELPGWALGKIRRLEDEVGRVYTRLDRLEGRPVRFPGTVVDFARESEEPRRRTHWCGPRRRER